jgi:RND family efflux transporter MFP subunit
MFKWATVVLAVAGFGLAFFLVRNLKAPAPPAPPLAEPAQAPFEQAIGARGIIESVDENVRVAAAVPALVAEVKVVVGQKVARDEVLIELDQREVRARRATVEAALREAELSLADWKDRMERVRRLSATSVASEDERKRTEFSLWAAEARLARAQAELRSLDVQIEVLTVRAPREGEVLQVNTRRGEYATPSAQEPLLLLGRAGELQLRADVDEDSAQRVRPGSEAVAFIKGRRDLEIPLRFVRIEPYVVPKRSLTGESSERVDTRVLQVIYRFEPPKVPVYVGQQMDVFIRAAP